jgi:electron transfer flavoprotein alpha subunit
MSTLVIAEHDNSSLKPATLSAVAAAHALGADTDILVAGADCGAVATAAAAVAGVGKVLVADNAAYGHQLAENVSLLIADVAANYDNILAPDTTNGKNIMPRVAALLDVGQISDIIAVESADTFQRPIYAGNVIATVKSSDAKKSSLRQSKQWTWFTRRVSPRLWVKRVQYLIVLNSPQHLL